jgi:ferredoxin-NADP reductase
MIKATLIKKYFHTESIVILNFTFDQNISYIPGQFLTFELDREQKIYRSYSIARSNEGVYEFAVVLLSGKGSLILRNMRVGRTLGVLGPFGEFTLDIHCSGRVILVATNTGIAPFASMVEQLRTLSVPVILLYGVSNSKDILYSELWDSLIKDIDFTWKVRVSKPHNEVLYNKGRVLDDLCEMNFTSQDMIYLCGHPHMIYDARQWLNSKFTTNIKIESFS